MRVLRYSARIPPWTHGWRRLFGGDRDRGRTGTGPPPTLTWYRAVDIDIERGVLG